MPAEPQTAPATAFDFAASGKRAFAIERDGLDAVAARIDGDFSRACRAILDCRGRVACSGMGTWARNPDARWRLRPEHVEMQAARQPVLLANAARAVRPGGRLVYSVCTLTRAETTAVADRFSKDHPGFEPLPFPHPLSGEACAGRAWIAPHDSMGDGMFIAAWKRIA